MACKCNEPPSIQDAYQGASIVLHGKILSQEFVSILESIAKAQHPIAKENFKKINHGMQSLENEILIKVTVEILQCYKGKLASDTVEIFTARKGAACGFIWFEVGAEFIIYGHEESYLYNNSILESLKDLEKKNTYWTHHCTRTTIYGIEEATALEKMAKR